MIRKNKKEVVLYFPSMILWEAAKLIVDSDIEKRIEALEGK